MRIGIFVERHWHYGRSICEGIAAFASARDDWKFDFPDWEVLKSQSALRKYEGFIVRVFDNPGRRPKDCYPPPIGVSERDSTRIFPISPQWLSADPDLGLHVLRSFTRPSRT